MLTLQRYSAKLAQEKLKEQAKLQRLAKARSIRNAKVQSKKTFHAQRTLKATRAKNAKQANNRRHAVAKKTATALLSSLLSEIPEPELVKFRRPITGNARRSAIAPTAQVSRPDLTLPSSNTTVDSTSHPIPTRASRGVATRALGVIEDGFRIRKT